MKPPGPFSPLRRERPLGGLLPPVSLLRSQPSPGSCGFQGSRQGPRAGSRSGDHRSQGRQQQDPGKGQAGSRDGEEEEERGTPESQSLPRQENEPQTRDDHIAVPGSFPAVSAGVGCWRGPPQAGSPDVFERGGLGAVGGGDARRQVPVSAPLHSSDSHKVPGEGQGQNGGTEPRSGWLGVSGWQVLTWGRSRRLRRLPTRHRTRGCCRLPAAGSEGSQGVLRCRPPESPGMVLGCQVPSPTLPVHRVPGPAAFSRWCYNHAPTAHTGKLKQAGVRPAGLTWQAVTVLFHSTMCSGCRMTSWYTSSAGQGRKAWARWVGLAGPRAQGQLCPPRRPVGAPPAAPRPPLTFRMKVLP